MEFLFFFYLKGEYPSNMTGNDNTKVTLGLARLGVSQKGGSHKGGGGLWQMYLYS